MGCNLKKTHMVVDADVHLEHTPWDACWIVKMEAEVSPTIVNIVK